jgi:hypothetical protein
MRITNGCRINDGAAKMTPFSSAAELKTHFGERRTVLHPAATAVKECCDPGVALTPEQSRIKRMLDDFGNQALRLPLSRRAPTRLTLTDRIIVARLARNLVRVTSQIMRDHVPWGAETHRSLGLSNLSSLRCPLRAEFQTLAALPQLERALKRP